MQITVQHNHTINEMSQTQLTPAAGNKSLKELKPLAKDRCNIVESLSRLQPHLSKINSHKNFNIINGVCENTTLNISYFFYKKMLLFLDFKLFFLNPKLFMRGGRIYWVNPSALSS